MPSAPVPCTNCRGFHYGPCHHGPRICHQCGGLNHIERYCPRKSRVRYRGPLPGTRRWCRKWDLDNDPVLCDRILNSIKISPGSAISYNGKCIYEGQERHFHTDRDRRRSMSPQREGKSDTQGVRERSPLRRRSCSPSRSSRDGFRDLPEPRGDFYRPQYDRQYLPQPRDQLNQQESRQALSDITTRQNLSYRSRQKGSTTTCKVDHIEDPHFVLGITKGVSKMEYVYP
ncbi:hypothetical protein B0O99DRAFT_195713 [Bisporella sp. PMI_857]|nr:hypothetical protein B0O99DRAFT_195713 [Bisporella sp. PMI_857]